MEAQDFERTQIKLRDSCTPTYPILVEWTELQVEAVLKHQEGEASEKLSDEVNGSCML